MRAHLSSFFVMLTNFPADYFMDLLTMDTYHSHHKKRPSNLSRFSMQMTNRMGKLTERKSFFVLVSILDDDVDVVAVEKVSCFVDGPSLLSSSPSPD